MHQMVIYVHITAMQATLILWVKLIKHKTGILKFQKPSSSHKNKTKTANISCVLTYPSYG